MKAGDELTRLVDNVYSLQAVADKFQSREALNVIRDLTDGKLVEYSAEGFFSKAWDKIKAFFKWLWEKISGFFKWVWEKIKALFGAKKKIKATPELKKIAEKNPKVASLIEETREAQRNNSIIAHFHGVGEALSGQATREIGDHSINVGKSKYTLNDVLILSKAMSNNRLTHSVHIMGIPPDELNEMYGTFMPKFQKVADTIEKVSDKFATVNNLGELRSLSINNVLEAAVDMDAKVVEKHAQLIQEMRNEGFTIRSYSDAYKAATLFESCQDNISRMKKTFDSVYKEMAGTLGNLDRWLNESANELTEYLRSNRELVKSVVLRIGRTAQALSKSNARITASLLRVLVQSINSLCNGMEDMIAANEYAQ